MAREIREYLWCDGVKVGVNTEEGWLPRHDLGEPANTRTFAMDGGKPMDVDLCDPCNSEMTLDELRVCIKEFGVAADPARKTPRYAANAGGVAGTVEKFRLSGQRKGREPKEARTEQCLWCPMDYTSSGWLGHLQKEHGFAGKKEALGTQCPACGVDGFETVTVHIVRSHPEFPSGTAAFIWARDNKDPYGVYAERRAAGKNVVEALPA